MSGRMDQEQQCNCEECELERKLRGAGWTLEDGPRCELGRKTKQGSAGEMLREAGWLPKDGSHKEFPFDKLAKSASAPKPASKDALKEHQVMVSPRGYKAFMDMLTVLVANFGEELQEVNPFLSEAEADFAAVGIVKGLMDDTLSLQKKPKSVL